MKQKLFILLLVLIMFACTACGTTITHGEVYNKEYREASTVIMMYPLTISNGKTTTTTIVPYTVYYPERYVIFIKDYNGEEWLTEDYYVSKEVYDQIEIGSMFEYDESRGDLGDEPHTKERKED